MDRNDLRELADTRLRDAEVLLRNGNHAGAYYLAGYVIECALKACIARQTQRHDFPDRRVVNASWTHDLAILVRTAKLDEQLGHELRTNEAFVLNWSIVKDWTEESRYERRSKEEAEQLYAAITDREGGVLRWVRRYW